MPRLYTLQSLWGMERLNTPGAHHWSLREQFDRIHDAGFDGISIHFYNERDIASWIDHAQALSFIIEGAVFPTSVEDLQVPVALAARYGIHHLAVQGNLRPYNAQAAVPVLQGWQALSREHGVPVHVETHRNTLTNDLWVMRELLDLVPDLTVLADLSHYVCGQEIHVPPTPRNAELIDRILQRAQAFHGRVATSEHIQVEIGWAVHRPWVDQFMTWWTQGFTHWLAQAQAHDTLTFTCELGPVPYAICDEHGRDRSDRWADAQLMKSWVQTAWAQALAQ